MERKRAIVLLNSLMFVFGAFAEKRFDDARSALADLIQRLETEPGIESLDKATLIAALRGAEQDLNSPSADERGAIAILERVSRKLWEDVVG